MSCLKARMHTAAFGNVLIAGYDHDSIRRKERKADVIFPVLPLQGSPFSTAIPEINGKAVTKQPLSWWAPSSLLSSVPAVWRTCRRNCLKGNSLKTERETKVFSDLNDSTVLLFCDSMTCNAPIDLKMDFSQSNMTYSYLPAFIEINFTALLFGQTKVSRLGGASTFQ